MSIRALVIDAAARAAVQKIVDFAAKPENWYKPGPNCKPPGDDPNYVVRLDTYRCVFTFTEDPNTKVLFRHLSISVPAMGMYPNPVAVNEIGLLFGFPDMNAKLHAQIVANRVDNCIVMAHPVLTSR
jgi:hypothetical protein